TCVPNSIRSVPDPEDPGKTIAPCTVIETRPLGGEAPSCNPDRGLVDLSPAEVTLTRTRLKAESVCDVGGKPPCSALSLCRLLESDARCHSERSATTAPGWCFIDPEDDPLVDASLAKYG